MDTQPLENVTELGAAPSKTPAPSSRSTGQLIADGAKAFGISVAAIILFGLVVMMAVFVIGKLMPPQP